MLAPREAGGVEVVAREAADAVVAFPDVGVLEDLLLHQAVGGEHRDQALDVAGVERPGVGRQQVIEGEAIFDRNPGQSGILHRPSARTGHHGR